MSLAAAAKALLDEYRSRPTLRAGSLITTVFGDSIAPRGGTVWLGSLIRAMGEFGISERLVRTSVFRLARDNWLESRQVGRRSFYSLTEEGRERFAAATHRIYGEPSGDWDGGWCLLLMPALETAEKESARREFGWLGFGALSANVLAHPSPDRTDLDQAIRRLGFGDRLVVMTARPERSDAPMRALARASFNLGDIDRRYGRFVAKYRPVLAALGKSTRVAPETAFVVRTLLIQHYRKVLLRDPQLPEALLPPGWHGRAAYQLCRNLYLGLHDAANRYLSETMETADGPLPPPAPAYFRRFGGLESAA